MANINEIAKLAKVSRTTVSRVLNNHPYVSEQKRNAVWSAVRELQYVPNLNAVNLSKGKTNIIGLLIPRLNHPFFSTLTEGIAQECKLLNLKLLIGQYDSVDEEEEFYKMLMLKQIDGVILGSFSSKIERVEELCKYGSVVSCEKTDSKKISSIYIEHKQGIMLGLNHLYNKGYKKIALCIGNEKSIVGKSRIRAYREFLKNKNLICDPKWVFTKQYSIEDGVRLFRNLLLMNKQDIPTAFIVGNDQVAAGIIYESKKNGYNLGIVGFDNQPISGIYDITTIDQPIVQLGSTALKVLNKLINDPNDSTVNIKLDVHLIERNST